FFYAVEVDASQGFELCPADVCAVDAGPAVEQAPPGPRFRILEQFENPLLERYGTFLAANGTPFHMHT
ncbi:MAG: alpha-L-glutamate ligase, partial [Actinobacteria bacterium]|nr:alpha-L-glutamate ligase [Actinomycetota bacterium]